jgi:hypothetical protein
MGAILMANFTFRGFTTGSLVALSAAQGGNTAQNSVSTWGQGSLAEISIDVTSTPVKTAPAPIWLEAVDLAGFAVSGPGAGEVYDPTFHEITYIWTIQGAPLSDYVAPQNMVPSWNNPNVTYGKRAAFCLTDPGTYVIELWAIDANGTTGTAQTTVVVVDPETVYPGNRTLVFAQDGNFSGAPAGATQISSLSILDNFIRGASVPTRVLFKRGETVLDIDLTSSSGSNGRIDHLGAWGSGPAPVLRPKPYDEGNMITWRSSGPETQITIENIKVQGYWDPLTETGSLGGGSPFYWRDKITSAKILLHKVEMTNCDAQQLSANAAPCDVLIADCIFENWQQYGCFCDRNELGKFAFIGSRFVQSPDALNGGPKKGMSNNHGPIRITRCRWLVGDVCDMFSNDGWSGGYDAQPCLRVGTHQTANTDIFMHWGRSVMENGYQIINMEGENTAAQDNPGNFVLDRLVLIGTARQRAKMVSCHKGGSTFRNMLLFQPNVPGYATGANEFFNFVANNPRNNNDDAPIRLYNVTAVSLQNAANENSGPMDLVGGTGSFSNVTIENNVLHIPNTSSPQTAAQPINTSTALPGITPRYKGVQYNYEHVNGSFSGSLANGASMTVPYSDLRIRNHNGDGPGTQTNRAYWQAIETTDTLHMFSLNGNVQHAANGDFTVSFGTSNVTITNTSGSSWSGNWWLALDRTSRLDSELPLQTQYANPSSVPVCTPLSGSSAIGGATSGLHDHLDFYESVRANPASQGAIQP